MEQLFGSKTRVKLLKLFLSNPNRSFYVREITRKIDEQINSVRRELANLLSLGVIGSDSTNNKLYYEVNQKNQYYSALRELFTGKKPSIAKNVRKTGSVTEETNSQNNSDSMIVDGGVWDKVGNIAGIAYSGLFTRDSVSPVDVMIIGDVPVARAEAAVSELEKQEGKELRYAVIELDEWRYRKQIHDKFWMQVMGAKKQIILDTEHLF
jgi:predicted transcriptional regulator